MLSRNSSTNNNNSAAPPAMIWRPARDNGAVSTPNSHESNNGQLSPSGSQFFQANSDSRVSTDSLRSFGRRTPSFSSISIPPQHRSPVQIIILDTVVPPRDPNPWARHAPFRPIERWHLPLRQAEEQRYTRSSSSHAVEQQNKALESLRKELYIPNSKRLIRTVNLYYRDTPVNPRDLDNEEDGKRCAICLEDFERGQEVMLTPCKHMFHEECIVPWARSNPQCPVCRFVFGPKTRESSSALPFNRNGDAGPASVANPGLSAQELLSILRALGDGFQWA